MAVASVLPGAIDERFFLDPFIPACLAMPPRELAARVEQALAELEDCCACPRNCHVNRLKAKDYPERAREAIAEMHRQVGDLRFGPDGMARRGLLVRHLVMPGHGEDAGCSADAGYPLRARLRGHRPRADNPWVGVGAANPNDGAHRAPGQNA